MKNRRGRRALESPAGAPKRHAAGGAAVNSWLRIVGGAWRGRKFRYLGAAGLRPMKDRVREAVFNLLGPRVSGGHAIDLFAGTGALGLEALSRTASRATFIERHRASCKVLRENVARLGAQDRSAIVEADTFRWVRHPSPLAAAENQLVPWLVFCSPPYDFYVERAGEMVKLLTFLAEIAPRESVFVVESDRRFDWGLLDGPDAWQLRDYPPARIGVRRL